MSTGLVVDTNVLAHADNPTEVRFADAVALVKRLLEGSETLGVDEGFDVVEARNRSRIGAEYVAHLRSGSPGYELVVHLARSNRIRVYPKRLTTAENRKICQLIRDTGDRVFVAVAAQQQTRLLVSHDYVDLQTTKRQSIEKVLAVRVRDAKEALHLLGDA